MSDMMTFRAPQNLFSTSRLVYYHHICSVKVYLECIFTSIKETISSQEVYILMLPQHSYYHM